MVSPLQYNSYRTEPLEVEFFWTLREEIIFWNGTLPKTEAVCRSRWIWYIFISAYARVSSLDKALRGFECTGIVSFYPNVFGGSDFTSSAETFNVLVEQVEPVAGSSKLKVLAGSSNQNDSRPFDQDFLVSPKNQDVVPVDSCKPHSVSVAERTSVPRLSNKTKEICTNVYYF